MKFQMAFTKIILLILSFIVLFIALFSFQASAGCGRWVIRENTDYLEDPIFDDAVKASAMSGATGTETGTESAAHDSTVNNSTRSKPEAKKAEEKARSVPDISGKWLFRLPENLGGSLDLIIMQTGDRLQGYGHVAENGSQVAATATGTVSRDAVNLDVRTVKSSESRRLDLALAKNTLEGSCELYDGDRLLEKGTTTATRN